ncbi:hypothetical protein R3P38DRAFT_3475239 [Favolaschia claudopus]|uniref:Uncharacterized protein n=1 Tax=Favolaschia claudopus TaxID=2862362 RepID=A0AAW0CFR2_9AGAR
MSTTTIAQQSPTSEDSDSGLPVLEDSDIEPRYIVNLSSTWRCVNDYVDFPVNLWATLILHVLTPDSYLQMLVQRALNTRRPLHIIVDAGRNDLSLPRPAFDVNEWMENVLEQLGPVADEFRSITVFAQNQELVALALRIMCVQNATQLTAMDLYTHWEAFFIPPTALPAPVSLNFQCLTLRTTKPIWEDIRSLNHIRQLRIGGIRHGLQWNDLREVLTQTARLELLALVNLECIFRQSPGDYVEMACLRVFEVSFTTSNTSQVVSLIRMPKLESISVKGNDASPWTTFFSRNDRLLNTASNFAFAMAWENPPPATSLRLLSNAVQLDLRGCSMDLVVDVFRNGGSSNSVHYPKLDRLITGGTVGEELVRTFTESVGTDKPRILEQLSATYLPYNFRQWSVVEGNVVHETVASDVEMSEEWQCRDPAEVYHEDLKHEFLFPETPWTYDNGSVNPELQVFKSTSSPPRGKITADGALSLPPYHPDYRPPEQDESSDDDYGYTDPSRVKVRRGSEGYEVRPAQREDMLARYLLEIGETPQRYHRYIPQPESEGCSSRTTA